MIKYYKQLSPPSKSFKMQREKLVFFYGSTDSSKCIRDLIASAKGSQASVESPDQSQSEVKSKHSSTVYTSLGMLRSDYIKVDGEGGNAYHVFGDATLKVLSKRIPRTKEELLEIRGIGKGILAKYGDRILQTIESAIEEVYD